MIETTLSVPEIHCDHCKMSIENAVRALDGVTAAAVSVAERTVTVAFETPASLDGIISAIEDQGYDVPGQ